MLIFEHGFMSSPGAYHELLAPLRAAGIEVITPEFYGAAAGLTGRFTVIEEAQAVAELVRSRSSTPSAADSPTARPWLAGHSRGGQAVWRAAETLGKDIGGLILIDPVDGSGPRSKSGGATDHAARIDVPTLIIGAGRGGSCAPTGLNHERFAAALPTATHIVIADMGHADILSGWALTLGRLVCRGGPHPEQYRGEVSTLMLTWLTQPARADGSD